MDVSRIRALRGPNLWSRHTAIEALVQCDPDHTDITRLPQFEARLRHLFPGMGSLLPTEHKAKVSLAHALESATLHLQTEAGCPVTFSRTTPTPEAGLYQVVVEYTEEPVGRLALKLAQQLLQVALGEGEFDLDAALRELRSLDEDIRLGPSTGSIVDAAVARGIPFRRLTEGSLVQFGWGSKQRRIQAAEVDRTSAIAESIAQDKELTKKLLAAAGVPVPKGRPVRDAEDAWKAAQEVGVPVVVKPRDGNQGKGVTVNVSTQAEVMAAYEVADEYGGDVLVERYLPGSDYRLLVVGDRLVAAARREPPMVIGDGKHTVRQLVDKVNADRAKMGAVMNRLQHVVENLSNVSTNSAASRSQIEDADYAKASSELARAQIIQHAVDGLSAPGIAAKMFEVLAAEGINIEMISTSTIRISCVVAEPDVERAVRALHAAFAAELAR